ALLDSQGKTLPRRSVADDGNRDDGIGGSTAVGVVGIPQQAGVVAGTERGHPAVTERGLEVVFGAPTDGVHLVDEQHAETSHVRSLHLDSDAENLVSSKG